MYSTFQHINALAPPPTASTQSSSSESRQSATENEQQSLVQGQDKVSLSKQGRILATENETPSQETQSSPQNRAVGEEQLTEQEMEELLELQKRDVEVKTHEQAHLAVAGQYASGGASYTYETGPNGKRYAVSGEVPINMSRESTPEDTVRKMQIVRRAALAPSNPSAADRQIAARASMMSATAQREVQQNHSESEAYNIPKVSDSSTGNEQSVSHPNVDSSDKGRDFSPQARRMILSAYLSQP